MLGLFNCLRKEVGTGVIRGVLIQDSHAPKFSTEDPFYAEQIKKDLTLNVLRNDRVWGSYRHLPLPEIEQDLVDHANVNLFVHGDIKSLNWAQMDSFPKNKNIVNVFYAGINFKYRFLVFLNYFECSRVLICFNFQGRHARHW